VGYGGWLSIADHKAYVLEGNCGGINVFYSWGHIVKAFGGGWSEDLGG